MTAAGVGASSLQTTEAEACPTKSLTPRVGLRGIGALRGARAPLKSTRGDHPRWRASLPVSA